MSSVVSSASYRSPIEIRHGTEVLVKNPLQITGRDTVVTLSSKTKAKVPFLHILVAFGAGIEEAYNIGISYARCDACCFSCFFKTQRSHKIKSTAPVRESPQMRKSA